MRRLQKLASGPPPPVTSLAHAPQPSIVLEILDRPSGSRGDIAELVHRVLQSVPCIDHHHVIRGTGMARIWAKTSRGLHALLEELLDLLHIQHDFLVEGRIEAAQPFLIQEQLDACVPFTGFGLGEA